MTRGRGAVTVHPVLPHALDKARARRESAHASHQLTASPTRSATARVRATSERYSVEKFHQLDAYCSRATTLRIVVVLVGVPLPGLLASIVPCFLPLQPLHDGPNAGLIMHIGCIVFSSTFGLFLTWLEVTAVPRTKYSLPQLLAVCVLACGMHCVLFALVAQYAVYPLPFVSVLGTPPLLCFIAVAHVVVFGSRLWQDPIYLASLRNYGPSVVFQMSQVVLYPAVSILFDHVTLGWQIALTIAFPLLKWVLKTQLKRLSRGLKDFSAEVAVCGIEITGSLYQSMIMQTSPTTATIALIIGLDLAQGLFVIRLFMDKYSKSFPKASLGRRLSGTSSSVGSLDSWSSLPLRHELIPLARQLIRTSKISSDQAILAVADRSTQVVAEVVAPAKLLTLTERRRTLAIALETLYVGEEMLLAEYFEVVIPFVNSIFIAVATQLPSAKYNSRLAPFYHSETALVAALQSIVLYSLLQGITLVVFHCVLRFRYGISALSYLAFILERHALSIIGKMLAWLPFILHFSIAQYGVDFSFQFDWTRTDVNRQP